MYSIECTCTIPGVPARARVRPCVASVAAGPSTETTEALVGLSTGAPALSQLRSKMNTLWRLGKATRGASDSPAEVAPIEWPPLRTLADFATEATFTAPHTDDELFARRLWRNVEYYQTNYICLLGVGLLLSVAADSFALIRLLGLAIGFTVILHLAADRGALPTENDVRRRWLSLVEAVAYRVRAASRRLIRSRLRSQQF